jgi:zinc/manganese transport system substrate-binding protein
MRNPATTLRGRTMALAAGLGLVLAACGGEADQNGEADPAEGTEEADGTEEAGGSEDAEPEQDATSDEDRLHVVATTSILGDMIDNLVDDEAEVTVLMPPGTDPHGYEPSADDGRVLREADLVVANGLDLEENLISVLEAAEEEGVEVFEVADQLDPIDFDWDGPGHDHGHDDDDGHGHDDDDGHGHDDDDGHGHDDDDHDHDHDGGDPHFWLDPLRSAEGVELIAERIAEASAAIDADELEQRATSYGDELRELDETMAARFETVPEDDRQLVTNHDALGYLADRYGFEVLDTVIPGATTQAEQDPSGFAELIETVEEADVPAIFAENTDSTTLAEQLQSEVVGRGDVDVEVVRIYTDALGEEGSGAETYLGLLDTTSTLITEALGGEA